MRLLILLVLLLFSGVLSAQELSSAEFHKHRTPLTNSFLKFQNEKQGRVAFLGGSITCNSGWRDSVCIFLQQKFPDTDFDFINAGVPSMGSTPGAFRFKQDVLNRGKVDLLFEEAAVNDATNKRAKHEILKAMEGIVRHAKTANPACDVVLLHFADPEKIQNYRNGEIPEVIQLHEKVAEHYKLSSIHLAKEVTARIDAGEFSWEKDFKDLHPSPFGQGIYARSIIEFLNAELVQLNDSNQMKNLSLPEALDKNNYCGGVLREPNSRKPIKGWTFVENWNPGIKAKTRANYVDVPMLVGEYPGKVINFPFKGTAVGIAVAAGPDAGIIEFSIDNSDWGKVDLFTPWSQQLYLPWFYNLASDLKNKKHMLQIRMTEERNPESMGSKCVLRYFYFNEIPD